MRKDPRGEWVRWEDFDRLQKQADVLEAENAIYVSSIAVMNRRVTALEEWLVKALDQQSEEPEEAP